jgi:hypothetical protein
MYKYLYIETRSTVVDYSTEGKHFY